MKLLIPSAKDMNEDTEIVSPGIYPKNTQTIIDLMKDIPMKELSSFYKISEKRAQKEGVRWKAMMQANAHFYPALYLFDGLMYRKIKRKNLSRKEVTYLKNHLFITTALYGIIPCMTPIAPHRLDFLNPLKVDGMTLKAIWKDSYNDFVLENEEILSLLSTEFEAIFATAIRERFTRVKFMELHGDRYKMHSTISKKGRGALITKMMEEGIEDIESIRNLSFDGYEYQANQSTEKELVFVKNIPTESE